LDLVVYSNPNKDVQRIKEAKSFPSLHNLHFDVIKSSIGLFMAELIHRSVMEEEPNQRLYNFLEQSVIALDEAGAGIGLFPIYFSLHLTNHLGFFPQNNFSENARDIFSLEEGEFTDQPVSEENAVLPPDSFYLSQIISTDYQDLSALQIPRNTRNALLIKIMRYYKLHMPNFQNLKSLPVLMNVLKE
jgi:DNA repair protein RecO (recombination protein O)